MLLTQDRSLFWEAPCEGVEGGCGETVRQKLNNLISPPLFTSPPSLRFLISTHFLTFVSSPSLLSTVRPSFPLKSLRKSSPCCPHLFSSPIFSHFLALVSYLVHPPRPPPPFLAPSRSPFLYSTFPSSSSFIPAVQSADLHMYSQHE